MKISQITQNKHKHRSTLGCDFYLPYQVQIQHYRIIKPFLTIAVNVPFGLLGIHSDGHFLPLRESPLGGQVAWHVRRHNSLI